MDNYDDVSNLDFIGDLDCEYTLMEEWASFLGTSTFLLLLF